MKKKIIRKIESSSIISFDLFDTLISRNVPTPKDVFYLVEENIDKKFKIKSNFKNNRIEAEKKVSSKTNGIYTLDNIYEELTFNYDYNDLIKFKNLELEIEEKLISINNIGREIYDFAKKIGKPLILVSDMYLPQVFLQKFLKKYNYQFDNIFISCECNCSKSNGTLYEHIIKKFKTKNILHIGDNFKSDYLMAKYHGWKSYHIKNIQKAKNIEHENILEKIIATIQKKECGNDCLYDFGFKYFGPFMLGFSQFLKKHIEDSPISFFSRDGFFMKEIFDKLYDNDTKYVYVSRRALIIPSLTVSSTLKDIEKSFFYGQKMSLQKLLSSLNLNYLSKEIKNIDLNKVYNKTDFFSDVEINNIYNNIILPHLNENIVTQKKYLEKYFSFVCKSKLNLVDIGWFGNMQKALEKLFPGVAIYGYYTGILSKKTDMIGYMFDLKRNIRLYYKEHFFNAFFELLFLAPHGSVLKYDMKGTKIIPIFGSFDKQTYETIRKIQIGALHFIDYVKTLNINLTVNSKVSLNMINFLANPPKYFLSALVKLTFEDENIKSLFKVSNTKNLLSKIKCVKNSIWKVAALKMNFFDINYSFWLEKIYALKMRLK